MTVFKRYIVAQTGFLADGKGTSGYQILKWDFWSDTYKPLSHPMKIENAKKWLKTLEKESLEEFATEYEEYSTGKYKEFIKKQNVEKINANKGKAYGERI